MEVEEDGGEVEEGGELEEGGGVEERGSLVRGAGGFVPPEAFREASAAAPAIASASAGR